MVAAPASPKRDCGCLSWLGWHSLFPAQLYSFAARQNHLLLTQTPRALSALLSHVYSWPIGKKLDSGSDLLGVKLPPGDAAMNRRRGVRQFYLWLFFYYSCCPPCLYVVCVACERACAFGVWRVCVCACPVSMCVCVGVCVCLV